MNWLFYVLILICILSAVVSEICSWIIFGAVCLYVILGILLDIFHVHKPWLNRLLGVLLFLGLSAAVIFSGGGYQAVILGLCLNLVWVLLGYRALSHERTADRVQVAVVAVLPLVCVALNLQALTFIAFFIAYFFVLMTFLATQSLAAPTTGEQVHFNPQLRVRRLASGRFWSKSLGMTLLAFLIGALLFLVIPRYGSDSNTVPGAAGTKNGFPDVDLGRTGKINYDTTLIFRANVPVQDEPYYWRIETNNMFDGEHWRSYYGVNELQPVIESDEKYIVEFIREWRDYRIPSLDEMVAVEKLETAPDSELRFYRDKTNSWRRHGWRNGAELYGFQFQMGHDMTLVEELIHNPVAWIDKYKNRRERRQLRPFQRIWPDQNVSPESFEKLNALQKQITQGARSDEEIVERVQAYLQKNYRYSLDRPVRNGSIVEDFLFEQKFGHCEMFSTAMAVLLNFSNIKVRNVTGFVSSEYREGYLNVRAAHAHSWVEVYLNDKWVRFDPTPSGAQEVNVNWIVRIDDWFSAYQTRDLYQWLGKYGLYLLLILVGAFGTSMVGRAVVRMIRYRIQPTVEVYASEWKNLMTKCEQANHAELTAIPLEKWWSDDMSEWHDIQAFAREYIQFRYNRRENSKEGALARFRKNIEIIRCARKIKTGRIASGKRPV